MAVVAGQPFTVTILDGYPLSGVVGARVEVPVTREIVSYWLPATLLADTPSPGENTWSVTLTPVSDPGDYLVVWRNDQTDSPEVFVPLTVLSADAVPVAVADFPDPDPSQITPSVDDVGEVERVRTIGRGGATMGTFLNADDQGGPTNPTADVVEGYISDAVDMVLTQLPEQFPTRYYPAVKRAITLQAALFVESSDYPESNEPDVARKERLLQTLITSLNHRISTDYGESYAAVEAAIGPVLA